MQSLIMTILTLLTSLYMGASLAEETFTGKRSYKRPPAQVLTALRPAVFPEDFGGYMTVGRGQGKGASLFLMGMIAGLRIVLASASGQDGDASG